MSKSNHPFCYEYARPAVSVDCVTFGLDEDGLKVLLIERKLEPFAGCWALPGGFVEMHESLETAAKRELEEETGLKVEYLEQLFTFGDVQRDPRDRVITVAYFALVKLTDHAVEAASDARQAVWFPVDETPDLAFDHDQILQVGFERLRNKIRYQPIGFDLLPKKFTLRQLQQLYEHLLRRPLDKRNFRKRILEMGILQELDEVEQGVAHRAARLYRFHERQYNQLVKQGFNFEI
ncbi:MAG: NUDIX hydrolase [Planctomycetales bacterium]|nr:NUDIX hydrolase [Planctomycetales bacterium]